MQRAGGWSQSLAPGWTQSRTHVGQGKRAAAAALIGLLVASQLVEGARLAEQRPDVLAVQAQRLLTVLQRLLIQALPERDRLLSGQCLLPSLPRTSAPYSTEDKQRWDMQEHRLIEFKENSSGVHALVKDVCVSSSGGLPMGTGRSLEGRGLHNLY